MNVAINTRFLLQGKMEGFGWYTYEISKRLVQNHPEHTFYFFFDRPFDKSFVFENNVVPVVLSPPARHPILFFIWFEWSVRAALKKHKIDIFFSPDGYLSLGSKVRQVGTIHDINFEHNPEDIPLVPRTYLRKYFPKFAKKAHKLITVSDYSKSDIIQTYGVPDEKVYKIWNGASEEFKALSDGDIQLQREELSAGQPYFLFVGSLHPRKNVHRLLEAYKKYLAQAESPWKLIIVGEALWRQIDVDITQVERANIIFTGRLDLDRLTKVMGAAGAFTYVPYFEGFGIPLVEAMRCGIPILAAETTALPEVAGDAAIYCDPFDEYQITKGLLKLSSNVGLRAELGLIGLQRAKQFSWDKAALEVAKVLEL
jgi:glycosyltransferase involved in cell wall biosynthesis